MNREKALLHLTDRQRQLIELRDHQKLTWAKVGEALGVGGQYAAQLHKAAVKELRQLEEVDELEWQTPPQAHSAPVYSTPEEKVLRATDNSFLTEGGSFKAPEPPKPRTVISRGEPAGVQPKVVVIRGIPVPQTTTVQKHWSAVTIRA
jgi:hypothetical protein